ncbi:sensor histidine kinase [Microtetraspora fusca]|uniref:sensor histidine kinase n=1 Tax=Microtetraspora fusca TaxID=1997 RepID=UPI000834DB98|nr:histidine kinase [Microtetraspora fusca]
MQALGAVLTAGVAALLLAEGLDTGFAPTTAGVVICGALCVAALAAPPTRSPSLTAVAVTASFLFSLASTWATRRPEHTPGMTELFALLLLVARAARRSPPLQAAALTAGSSLAVMALPLRIRPSEYIHLTLIESVLLCCLPLMIMLGLLLRLRDLLRAREHAAIRQEQRLEYARDLHDFVAHHVSAIVTQTKAVRFVGADLIGDPEKLDRMLAGIESAGEQALDSMRGVVSVLRDGTPAPVRPARSLPAMLSETAAAFSTAGPPATTTVDPALSVRYVPPVIVDLAHRVVQESLTNVRKHAPTATRVTIHARPLPGVPGWLEVSVSDDGAAPAGPACRTDGSGDGTGRMDPDVGPPDPCPVKRDLDGPDLEERGPECRDARLHDRFTWPGRRSRTRWPGTRAWLTEPGRRSASSDRATGGGFGLVGLAERVEKAGGRITAGPQEGIGWLVLAELPLTGHPSENGRRAGLES